MGVWGGRAVGAEGRTSFVIIVLWQWEAENVLEVGRPERHELVEAKHQQWVVGTSSRWEGILEIITRGLLANTLMWKSGIVNGLACDGKFISPPDCNPCIKDKTEVEDLLRKNGFDWDSNVVSRLFIPGVFNTILSSSITLLLKKDKLIWHSSANGSFSLNHACLLGFKQETVHS
uniref:Uncharacterized protein n=1 Tax=Cannabis sativa TaxID=3483 RepID=A0A803PNE5_CANSA